MHLYVDVTMAECPGGSGPEKPRHAAATDPWLRGPGGGASGRASLCGVRPQERRLSSRILTITSGPGVSVLSARSFSSKTLGDTETQHTSVCTETTQCLSYNGDTAPTWLHSKTSFTQTQLYSDTLCVGILMSFEVKKEDAPIFDSCIISTGYRSGKWCSREASNTSALYNKPSNHDTVYTLTLSSCRLSMFSFIMASEPNHCDTLDHLRVCFHVKLVTVQQLKTSNVQKGILNTT